jgi:polyphosphate kinase 2 (PPK2 family)
MFESAELGHQISRSKYEREVPALREALLEAQYDLLEKRSSATLILIGGVDGAGKGETVNVLNEWLDPRHVHTHALGVPTEDERARPAHWRFWRSLPPRGKIGTHFGSWYTQPSSIASSAARARPISTRRSIGSRSSSACSGTSA